MMQGHSAKFHDYSHCILAHLCSLSDLIAFWRRRKLVSIHFWSNFHCFDYVHHLKPKRWGEEHSWQWSCLTRLSGCSGQGMCHVDVVRSFCVNQGVISILFIMYRETGSYQDRSGRGLKWAITRWMGGSLRIMPAGINLQSQSNSGNGYQKFMGSMLVYRPSETICMGNPGLLYPLAKHTQKGQDAMGTGPCELSQTAMGFSTLYWRMSASPRWL